MKNQLRSSSLPPSTIESLEARIAPAGVVIAGLDHGKLTLSGDDNGDNFSLQQLGPKLFRLSATNNTTVQLGMAGVPVPVLDLVGAVDSIDATFGAGNDNFTFSQLKLKGGVTIHAGDGGNFPTITDSIIGGNVAIFGGSNADAVSISGLKTALGGKLSCDLGAGTNTLTLNAHDLALGSLSVHGGAGQNNLVANSSLLKIKAGADLDFAASSGSSTSFNTSLASLGGSLVLHGGAGQDDLNITGIRTSIKGSLSFDGAAGAASVSASPIALLVGGSVAVTVGDNPAANAEYIRVTGTHQLKVGGSVDLVGKSGLYNWNVGGELTDIAGHFSLTEGDHATGNNQLLLHGEDHLRIGKSFTVQQGMGAFTTSVQGGNLLQVGGAVNITNGDHAAGTTTFTNFNSPVATKLGAVSIHQGAGTNTTRLTGIDALTLGSFSLTGGLDQDQVFLTGAKTRVAGAVSFDLGLGDGSVQWSALTRLEVGGALQYSASGASTQLRIDANVGRIAGNVTADFHTSAAGYLELRGDAGLVQLAHDLTIVGDNAAHLSVELGRLGVSGATKLSSGAGQDDVSIDDSVFGGTFTAALGDGTDKVSVDTRNTTHAAICAFLKSVKIDLGAGNGDLLFLGGGLPTERILFAAPASFDGGSGTSDSYFSAAANTYKLAAQPVLVGFD